MHRDRSYTHTLSRWARAGVLTCAAATWSASARPADAAPCVAKMHHALEAVARAQRKTLQACIVARDRGLLPSAAACVDTDRFGWVARARARTARVAARLCATGGGVGYTSAAAVNAAGAEAAPQLARGLLGRELDAALRGDPGVARCQRDVLDRALRCSARALHRYVRCAATFGDGAADPTVLVACKPLPDGANCDARLANAIARSCAGQDLAALFPGCAGDLGACARAHAERSASQAVNAAAGLCTDVLPGSLPEETLLRCFAPPAQEPITYRDVPLPPGVYVTTVNFDASGEHLLVDFTAPDVVGTQVAQLGLDGGDFRCLTCGGPISGNLKVVQHFNDGQRLLVVGNNGPNPNWNVLECAPSVLDCQQAALLRIQLPPNPDPTTPVVQYRVPWVSLDNDWFVWTEVRLRGPGGNLSAIGRLIRDGDRYVVQDARVFAPPFAPPLLGVDSARWRNFTQPFEAKYGGLRGGRDWVEAGTPNAGHYDTSVIDLATGALRRLTHHPDHDEGVRFSPDEQWAVLQTGRTDNRIEFLGLLPRPPYIDWIAFSLHFVAIAGAPSDGISPGSSPNERDCYVDPWLLDRWFERGDYLGQRLERPADGWVSIEGNAGSFDWSPDGTQIAMIDRRWRGAGAQTRLRIATLVNRTPLLPSQVVPIATTPEPTWAVPYEDWIVPDTFGVTVIPGTASGSATIVNDFANTLSGSARVTYDHYSDDGASFLDGYEEIRIPVLVLNGAEYEVDLTLSGAHQGSMRGSAFYDFLTDVNSGEVVSTLDGHTVSGPKSCFQAGLIPLP
ncbi:MAG: hypothetical protein SF182_04425 [Deltaproteobacteria bacterium]|nr:hypothetical protein [Deltaproteobacteria bacterium]